MIQNKLLKLLCSIPIILIFLYFIPFLGICLIIFRYFVYKDNKRISTPIILVGVGILIIIPKFINIIINTIKINLTVPYLENIINSKIYNIDFLNYSKLLICVGIISLIVSVILKNIVDKVKNKLNSGIKDYIEEREKINYEISKKNDMEIKIKQEKAKTTNYVRCSNCGSDNILSDKVGRCKFCRSVIENKN